jgi:uncharacterized protein with gpF-like domain
VTKLVATSPKPVHVPATRPNAGIEVAYRKRLLAALAAMEKNVLRTVSLLYADDPPELAQDESPAAALAAAMVELRRRWDREFSTIANTWGRRFTADATGHADRAFAAQLRKAGFTVKFTMSAKAQDVFTATLKEQVNLITSISAEAMTQLSSVVAQSVTTGRAVGDLAKALREQFGVERRRAATIARDQNSKATATITRVRQEELGITQARWSHSAGGKVPRPEHVAFSKGAHRGQNPGPIYDIAKGALLEGKWTWPGVEINCRCVSVSILPGLKT